jgi:MFS family permease
METIELVILGFALSLNVLFGWLGARWVARKGYPDWRLPVFVASLFAGFVLPLILISVLPGRRHPAPRRSLHRKLPNARMPQPRKREPVEA